MSGIQQVTTQNAARHGSSSRGAEWPELAPGWEPGLPPGLLLRETVQQSVLPHLIRLHATAPTLLDPLEIDALARRAATGDPKRLGREIASMLEGGAAPNAVCLEVLAPAARILGELWEQDEYDFVTVTIGMLALQRALVRLVPIARTIERARNVRVLSILMVPVPGEQHQFGLLMAGGIFRRAGWAVTSGLSPEIDALRRMVETKHYDALGFSASCERHAEMLARSIDAVRRASCNAELRIVVGGPLCAADPAIASQLGADMIATDSVNAPRDLALLLPRRSKDKGAGLATAHEGRRPSDRCAALSLGNGVLRA
jgi:methanogenic corrinoid protein MtbC1